MITAPGLSSCGWGSGGGHAQGAKNSPIRVGRGEKEYRLEAGLSQLWGCCPNTHRCSIGQAWVTPINS